MRFLRLNPAKLTAFVITVLFLQPACRKADVLPAFVQPAMHYTDFADVEVVNLDYTYIDINADGKGDFFFQALPLGEAGSPRTRLRLYIYSTGGSELLIGEPDDQTPALKSGEIVRGDAPNYTWYPAAASALAEEVRPDASSAVYWQGNWKDASPAYLPIRVNKGGQSYYGWLQLSVDKPGRKLIIQRAGLSTEAGRAVKAGS